MGATGAHESRGGRMSMRSAQDRMSVGRGDEGTTTPTRLELTWTPTRLRSWLHAPRKRLGSPPLGRSRVTYVEIGCVERRPRGLADAGVPYCRGRTPT